MSKVWAWLEGKKTYIGAGIVALAAVAGFWFGVIDATQLGEGLGAALAIVGLAHKGDRQIAAVVKALEDAKAKKDSAGGAAK